MDYETITMKKELSLSLIE